jgi:hypothetical protein
VAKLEIAVEENEFALYDVWLSVNGEEVWSDGNYRTETLAFSQAYVEYNLWRKGLGEYRES